MNVLLINKSYYNERNKSTEFDETVLDVQKITAFDHQQYLMNEAH